MEVLMQLTEKQVPVVLAALYNNAVMGGGMAALHCEARDMTLEEAKEIVADRLKGDYASLSFDYVKGRPLKMDLTPGKDLRFWGYDRDSGEGRGEKVINFAILQAALDGTSNPDPEKLFQQLVYWEFVSKDCTLGHEMATMIHIANEMAGKVSINTGVMRPEGETPCTGCRKDRKVCGGHPDGFIKKW
jgi:hypothetical protein